MLLGGTVPPGATAGGVGERPPLLEDVAPAGGTSSKSSACTGGTTRPTGSDTAEREASSSAFFETGTDDDNPGRPYMDILVRSWQDLGKILAKIVTRYCQELQDAMVRSYQESHVSKKNLTKKPNMARKKLLRTA